jgi:hypothetical protein
MGLKLATSFLLALANPLAALIPLIDPRDADDARCGASGCMGSMQRKFPSVFASALNCAWHPTRLYMRRVRHPKSSRFVSGRLEAIRATFFHLQRIPHEPFDTDFGAIRHAEPGRL